MAARKNGLLRRCAPRNDELERPALSSPSAPAPPSGAPFCKAMRRPARPGMRRPLRRCLALQALPQRIHQADDIVRLFLALGWFDRLAGGLAPDQCLQGSGMTRGKALRSLSNRRERPLQSPACYRLKGIRELQLIFWVLVPGPCCRAIGCRLFIGVGFDRVLEKPLHLSEKARF